MIDSQDSNQSSSLSCGVEDGRHPEEDQDSMSLISASKWDSDSG